MIILVLILMLVVVVALFTLTGMHLYSLLKYKEKKVSRLKFGICFGLSIFLAFTFFSFTKMTVLDIPKIFIVTGYSIIGVIMYLVLIMNFSNLMVWILKLVKVIKGEKYYRVKYIVNVISLCAILVISVYGLSQAKNLQVNAYEIQTGDTNEEKLNIVLLSDLHLGYIIDEDYLEVIVDEINQLNPDLVLIAGDVFDGEPDEIKDQEKVIELFNEINSKYGVYAALGNHDAGENFDDMVSIIEASNIVLLQDESIVVDERFIVAGRRDSAPIGYSGELREELDIPVSDLPVIVMDHQPSNIDEYGSEVDLIVSGHTHRGQMFPFNYATDLLFDVDYGYYRESDDSPQVIVTSGAGSWGPPMRVYSRSEIVQIDFYFD